MTARRPRMAPALIVLVLVLTAFLLGACSATDPTVGAPLLSTPTPTAAVSLTPTPTPDGTTTPTPTPLSAPPDLTATPVAITPGQLAQYMALTEAQLQYVQDRVAEFVQWAQSPTGQGWLNTPPPDIITTGDALREALTQGPLPTPTPSPDEMGARPLTTDELALEFINRFPPEAMTVMPGIGPVLADRIAAARPYSTIEELVKVVGISMPTVENILQWVATIAPAS